MRTSLLLVVCPERGTDKSPCPLWVEAEIRSDRSRAPAPDLAALSAKLDLAVDQDVASLTGGEACMAALKRDARRLAAAQVRG